ncbi:MAG: aspartate carbamoyltransferase regulatory subunit [Thermoproteales archaeon]|nr:aspartate carbamoyltransferase regulatory subunit [Thermoproteales archaeon]
MSEEEKRLIVTKIKDGTVIDHIDAGRALYVLKILGITGEEDFTIAVVMNVESKRMGRKDIVKLEKMELRKEQVDEIALIAPNATINIIRNYRVVKKYKVDVPKVIEGLINCINPNCITNQKREPVRSTFLVKSLRPLILICKYCGEEIHHEDIIRQLTGV